MPDVPNNASTNANISLGGLYYGQLETVGDRDWVRIYLNAGSGAEINLSGNSFLGSPLQDPYLRVYDRNGSLIEQNDDINTGGGNFNSELTFGATYSGYYYIEAASWNDELSGGYEITALAAVVPVDPPVPPVETITWGTSFPATGANEYTVNVYFAPAGTYLAMFPATGFDDEYGYTTDAAFNAFERAQFNAIFDQLETFTNLNFVVVTDPNLADLTLGLDLNEMSADGLLGVFNPQGEVFAGNGVFNGDLWDRTAGGDLERGGYSYVTIVHELLHGLGLSHPHDDGGTSSIMSGVSGPEGDFGNSQLNQGIFTTMSYNSGYASSSLHAAPFGTFSNLGFEGGPMALDIAALQAIYGTGSGYRSGNTTYNVPEPTVLPGLYWEAIWDTGGYDRIAYDGVRSVTIDLRMASLRDAEGGGGYVSAAFATAGGYTIANGVVIEAALGGFGNDMLTGNYYNNLLRGRGGNDTIFGREGADTLLGDNGNDLLNGGRGNDRLHGDAGADRFFGGDGADTILGGSGRDTAFGGYGNDFIHGNTENDTIYGNQGNDTLRGGNNADLLHGGLNHDTLYGDNGNDRLFGFTGNDVLHGGAHYDRLFGGEGADELYGGYGNDVLRGGRGGDILNGGAGADTFVFGAAFESTIAFATQDVIVGFNRGQDRIDLSLMDSNPNMAGNQAFDFVGQQYLRNGADGQVRYQTTSNGLFVAVDANSDGVADMHIFVQGVSHLNASDFIL